MVSKYLDLCVKLNAFMYDAKIGIGTYIKPNKHITEERIDKLIKEYQETLMSWHKDSSSPPHMECP